MSEAYYQNASVKTQSQNQKLVRGVQATNANLMSSSHKRTLLLTGNGCLRPSGKSQVSIAVFVRFQLHLPWR